MSSWADQAIFYHIYPLGFCGVLAEDKEKMCGQHKLMKVIDWIPHLKEMGVTAIYFGPVCESVNHGYDTIDYYQIDKRLGTDEDFEEICMKLHKAEIKVVIDGVFNHVGRDFFAFKDVQEKREGSLYKDWFININFCADSPYHDGFSYEGWEGCYDLVKLNLWNEEVRQYLYGAVEKWMKIYDIDGIRLDVAYCLEEGFLQSLRRLTDGIAQSMDKDFWLMGEMIHGDYNRLLKPGMLHSVTDYECYKGIYSSHNDKNYFEINYSMNRLFAKGGLYEGRHLYNFVDNHDVNRIASILKQSEHMKNVYTLLFTMPGIPSIYYGSEWQVEGKKENGSDAGLRVCLELDEMAGRDQSLCRHIQKLADIKKKYVVLNCGLYEQVAVKNEQLIFARNEGGKKIYVVLNLAGETAEMSFRVSEEITEMINLLDQDKKLTVDSGECRLEVAPYSSMILINSNDKRG